MQPKIHKMNDSNDYKIDLTGITEKVLSRLKKMDYEQNGGNSCEQLVFPVKNQAKRPKDRVSEQELRFLFIEEFKKSYPDLFYSVETPTDKKYCFKDKDNLKVYEKEDKNGQSALLDMCVFEREASGKYKRILNIEFKHIARSENIEKDILKLIAEKENGAFIQLLDNTDKGTRDKYIGKLEESFEKHKKQWKNNKKTIQLIVISLQKSKNGSNNHPFVTFITLSKSNMDNLKNTFNKWTWV
jgi:hypothetical protein